MENQNKYYTPTIEEFHVGFEYEINLNFVNWERGLRPDIELHPKWISKDSFDQKLKDYLSIGIKNNSYIRVKHLDGEAIESLGWELNREREYEFTVKNYHGRLNVPLQLYHKGKDYILIGINKFDGDHNKVCFTGSIKNKSELKRLMKQLNII